MCHNERSFIIIMNYYKIIIKYVDTYPSESDNVIDKRVFELLTTVTGFYIISE